jgi:hypothetical protein
MCDSCCFFTFFCSLSSVLYDIFLLDLFVIIDQSVYLLLNRNTYCSPTLYCLASAYVLFVFRYKVLRRITSFISKSIITFIIVFHLLSKNEYKNTCDMQLRAIVYIVLMRLCVLIDLN